MFAINIKKLILNKNYNLTSIIYIYNIYMNSEQKEPEQIIPVSNEFELRNLVDKNGIPSQTINLDSINNLSLDNNTKPIAQNFLTQDQMFNMMPNINDNIQTIKNIIPYGIVAKPRRILIIKSLLNRHYLTF